MSKKKYIVVPRTTSAMDNGLATSKGNFSFNGKTAKIVDSSLASEIDHQHGLKGSGDVWVHEDENYTWHERNDGMTNGRDYGIHRYTFSGVDTTGFRITKDNGYVWVWKGGRQVRVTRLEAEQEGYEIVGKGKHAKGNDRRSFDGER